MPKTMLIDATHSEETRVAVVDGNRLVEYDYESKVRKQLKGSVFLAKVTRVEPSLQAAFVNFGGNRHGFLPFSEIHPDYFRIPVADREALMAAQQAELEEHDEVLQAQEAEIEQLAAQGDEQPSDSSEDEEEEEDDLEPIVEVGGEDQPLLDDEEEDDSEEEGDDEKEEVHAAANNDNVEEDAQDGEKPVRNAPIPMQSREDVLHGPAAQSDEEEDDEDGQNGEDDADDSEGSDDAGQESGEASQDSADGDEQGEQNNNQNRNNRGRGRGRRFGGRGKGRHNGGRQGGDRDDQRVDTIGGDGADGDRPFRFNLKRNYKIQEVIKRGQIMLIQVSKEERGNKGAAVTTYLSMPGRYCVLMPNSPRGGGVSRKIASFKDRKRMKETLDDLSVPEGMSVILRTAGVTRTKVEIKRDLDYLTRLWNTIREHTLKSVAPALIYEEGNLIKRAIRDLYSRDIEDVYVAGEDGFKNAREFMKMLMPSHAKKVQEYKNDRVPMFHKFGVENQISEMGEPVVTLKSGGYLVINPTEALVSVDVNSGRATKERHIEDTALKTNLEAADEVARQLRLRDLGGLVVIDFIDMEDRRNNRKVEQRLRDALSSDRARIQVGRISSFGLLELSRQRLNPSLAEAQQEVCAHCAGTGRVKTLDFSAISIIRALEVEGIKSKGQQDIILTMATSVALYIMNNKRKLLNEIEARYGFTVSFVTDDTLSTSQFKLETTAKSVPVISQGIMSVPVIDSAEDSFEEDIAEDDDDGETGKESSDNQNEAAEDGERDSRRRRGRRGGRNRNRNGRDRDNKVEAGEEGGADVSSHSDDADDVGNTDESDPEEGRDDSRGNRPPREGGNTRNRNRGGRNRNRGGRPDNRNRPRADNDQGAQPMLREDHAPRVEREVHAAAPIQAISAAPVVHAARPAPELAAPVRKDYETVNKAPENKKKGWWNKLIE